LLVSNRKIKARHGTRFAELFKTFVMKQLQRLLCAFVLSAAVIGSHCNAQSRTKLSLETDPSTFLLEGYSFHVRVQPANCERWLLGAGTYGIKMPAPFVDLNKDNRNEGWNARIRNAYALYAEFYFHKANQKWFVGEQLGIQNYRVTNDFENGGSADFSNLLLMTYAGYSWHPGKGSFYVKPWAGLGYTKKVDGTTQVGAQAYDVAPIFPFVTFHIGYEF
jgi:hypothetical protein